MELKGKKKSILQNISYNQAGIFTLTVGLLYQPNFSSDYLLHPHSKEKH